MVKVHWQAADDGGEDRAADSEGGHGPQSPSCPSTLINTLSCTVAHIPWFLILCFLVTLAAYCVALGHLGIEDAYASAQTFLGMGNSNSDVRQSVPVLAIGACL